MSNSEELAILKSTLEQYRKILMEHGLLPIDQDQLLNQDQKISAFLSYFRFRFDVYAERFIKKDGKQGWGPACHNKFKPGICSLGKGGNCGTCKKKEWIPLTSEILEAHFKGKNRGIGGYPLIPGSQTCYLLAIDFDDDNWLEDLRSVYEVAVSYGLYPVMERSASGNGGHLWIFFSEAVPAITARKLGDGLLQKAMLINRNLSLKSFDRMFPSQDGVSSDGFGNLIAIPLRNEAIKQGNTVFINESGQRIEHQIEYLLTRPKASANLVQRIADELDTPDFFFDDNQLRMSFGIEDKASKELFIAESNELIIKKKGLNAVTTSILKRVSGLYNQEYFRRQKQRLWVDRSSCPRMFCYLEEDRSNYYLPRGCLDKLQQVLPLTEFHIEPKLNRGKPIAVQFNGELRPQQDEALSVLLRYDIGVLKAYPSFGKTVTGIAAIARLQVSTLIIVPTIALQKQWIERLNQFLILPEQKDKRKSYIGRYSGSSKRLGYQIDVAVVDSLANAEDIPALTEPYGLILVDECHHAASSTFTQVLRSIGAEHIYGLTATDHRRDGMDKVINMFCGNIRYTASTADARRNYQFKQVLIPRYTNFRCFYEPKHFSELYELLIKDQARNQLIFNDVLREYREAGKIIVLSDRIKHLETLKGMLELADCEVYFLHGSINQKERDQIIAEVRSKGTHEKYILLSTAPLLGEGFDLPSLKALFLVTPLSGEGRVTQYTGRLHRNYEGKDVVKVYDYVDSEIPSLNSMYFKRLATYRKEGYVLQENTEEEPIDRILYPSESFLSVLRNDLEHCNHEVIVFTDTPTVSGILFLQKDFLEQIHRGIHIVFIVPESCRDTEEETYLTGMGGNLVYQDHHKHYLVLDQSTVWSFSFDLLSSIETDEMVTRRENEVQFVSELVETIPIK